MWNNHKSHNNNTVMELDYLFDSLHHTSKGCLPKQYLSGIRDVGICVCSFPRLIVTGLTLVYTRLSRTRVTISIAVIDSNSNILIVCRQYQICIYDICTWFEHITYISLPPLMMISPIRKCKGQACGNGHTATSTLEFYSRDDMTNGRYSPLNQLQHNLFRVALQKVNQHTVGKWLM